MIAMLSGKIFHRADSFIILNVQGVGYKVYVPISWQTQEETVTLFTHTHVREDLLELYGFPNQEDLAIFELENDEKLQLQFVDETNTLHLSRTGEIVLSGKIQQSISPEEADRALERFLRE